MRRGDHYRPSTEVDMKLTWKRVVLTLAVVLLVTPPAMAASTPSVTGHIKGRELCPESVCGAAVFAGAFVGLVNGKLAAGSFWGAVQHDLPLPTPGNSVSITGGTWLIWTNRGSFSGTVEDNGTITAHDDNTFDISMTLDLTGGGSGTVTFSGTLDHNVFPPSIVGTLSQ
jgi:hypothetical protein